MSLCAPRALPHHLSHRRRDSLDHDPRRRASRIALPTTLTARRSDKAQRRSHGIRSWSRRSLARTRRDLGRTIEPEARSRQAESSVWIDADISRHGAAPRGRHYTGQFPRLGTADLVSTPWADAAVVATQTQKRRGKAPTTPKTRTIGHVPLRSHAFIRNSVSPGSRLGGPLRGAKQAG